MRVSLHGNVAQNAYLLAYGLRNYTTVEADSYDRGTGVAMWTPQWEHGDFDIARLGADSSFFTWAQAPMRNGFTRPSWARIQGENDDPLWFPDEQAQREWYGVHKASGGQPCMPVFETFSGPARFFEPCSTMELPEHVDEIPGLSLPGLLKLSRWRTTAALQKQYDLMVLFGAEARNGVMLPAKSYIAFEHATLRHVEQEASTDQRLLAAAYRRAAHVVITNADCRRSAEVLGLENYSFIPHPVDTEWPKFHPGATWRSAQLRKDLLAWTRAEVLVFSPTRHSSNPESGMKANEVLLHAFAQYMRSPELPRAHLLLCLWGRDVPNSQELSEELGIAQYVSWVPLLPKLQLADLYRACDVVCDQFSTEVGSFGTITVEALACGKPVITHINREYHTWCEEVLPPPPALEASSAQELFQQLERVATHQNGTMTLGHQGFEWVQEYHSLERVARLHEALYTEVLAEQRARELVTT